MRRARSRSAGWSISLKSSGKALFGRKSERLGADERQLSFDDLGTAIAEAGGQAEPSERGP